MVCIFPSVSLIPAMNSNVSLIRINNKRNKTYGYSICPSNSLFPEYKNKRYWKRSILKDFIRKIILKFGKSDYDCIIFTITSHGINHSIFCSDHKQYQIHDIHNKISNKKKKMGNIPKIFFIDACREDKRNFIHTNEIFQSFIDEQNENSNHNLLVTVYGNSFGKKTFSDKINGSYFIAALCKILKQNINEKKNWNLSQILYHTKIALKKLSNGTQLIKKDGDVEMDLFKFQSKLVQQKNVIEEEKKDIVDDKISNNEMLAIMNTTKKYFGLFTDKFREKMSMKKTDSPL